ncbi:Rha family transcriptional regulator [Luteimonas sp. XNQY3]|nr:Rha family transcriptional regulator [Luteimonas sp. XNQY3]MCD9005236.1 Rha family transcriptional regulator [Luteimonas sp. XNQY3]
MSNVIHLARHDGEPRVDTLEIAHYLGTDHASTIKLVRRHVARFEKLGRVRFEIRAFATRGGQQEREIALLNEDQAYLLLAFSRNSERVMDLKVALVQAFGDCRRNGAAHALTYWQQLQEVDAADRESLARASAGSHAMLARRREKPILRERRKVLEAKVAPDLFKIAA